ncbi:hypothetical protein OG879_31410 [Streptomyces caniferus]|uniref:hypothetical protein n=1 Tax=Streptomyces caniferus TaxID=285557 RepID=UPI002E2AB606|nr:hypothetical protein [Streptomyces caniferus]
MAELNDWTCEFNGLVMGEPDSPISIVAVDGLLTLPEVRTSDLTLVQRHGLYAGDDYLGGRTVTMTLEVYGSTREEFTDALTSVQAAFTLGTETAFRFRFPGAAADQTAYVMARCRKRSAPLDLNFANRVCNVAVELFATQPYILGDAAREVTVRSSVRETQDGGLKFPATMPFTIVAPSAPPPDPVARFRQYGSIAARPVITVTSASNPTLHDDVTKAWFSVAYSGSFSIDSAAEHVYDSRGNDITGSVLNGSTWPEYRPGDHRLRLVHGDSLTQATAVLSWVDRWV